MKITFKDVGQGDSIIIEWLSGDGKNKIGIVDCKCEKNSNPVLEYIKDSGYKDISFMILSHPHSDHYSGFVDLLKYCEDEKIHICRFGHTLGFLGVELYWKYFEIDTKATDDLSIILEKLKLLKDLKLLGRTDNLNDISMWKIDDNLSINCLSVSNDDIVEYMHKVNLDPAKDPKKASEAANLLSTILKLTYKDHLFLLTSDAEKNTIRRALGRDPVHFNDQRFHIIQIPHHGSFANHLDDFWSVMAPFTPRYAVASAGGLYKHPSIKVLRAFDNAGYDVHCTNIAGGMIGFVEEIAVRQISIGDFGGLAQEYLTSNDRSFVLEGDFVRII